MKLQSEVSRLTFLFLHSLNTYKVKLISIGKPNYSRFKGKQMYVWLVLLTGLLTVRCGKTERCLSLLFVLQNLNTIFALQVTKLLSEVARLTSLFSSYILDTF